jgi:ABC-type transport system involved in multi-copper enzyme maturation permease subunit
MRSVTVLFGMAIIAISLSASEWRAMAYGSLFGMLFVVYGARGTALMKRLFPRWLKEIGTKKP